MEVGGERKGIEKRWLKQLPPRDSDCKAGVRAAGRHLPAGMVSSDCMVFLKSCQHLDIGSYNSKIKNSDFSWKNLEDLAQLDQNSLMATAK